MDLSRLALSGMLLVAALLVELSLLTRLPLPGATPDLVLLVVIALALAHGETAGMLLGFAAGLALDLVPPADGPAGRWALVLCLVGYLAGLARGAADRSPVLPWLLVALLAAASVGLYAGLGALFDDVRVARAGFMSSLAQMLPTAVLYDLLLFPLVGYPVLVLSRRARRQMTPRRR